MRSEAITAGFIDELVKIAFDGAAPKPPLRSRLAGHLSNATEDAVVGAGRHLKRNWKKYVGALAAYMLYKKYKQPIHNAFSSASFADLREKAKPVTDKLRQAASDTSETFGKFKEGAKTVLKHTGLGLAGAAAVLAPITAASYGLGYGLKKGQHAREKTEQRSAALARAARGMYEPYAE